MERRLHDLDAFAAQGRQPVVDMVGRADAFDHVIVDFVEGEEALGLADGDEIALLALVFLARHGSSLGRQLADGFDVLVVRAVVVQLLVGFFDHVVGTSQVEGRTLILMRIGSIVLKSCPSIVAKGESCRASDRKHCSTRSRGASI